MKIFGFLLKLVLLIGLVIWLADRPGTAQIEWRDIVIETSAAVLAVIVAAIAYALILLHRLWRYIIDGPYIWSLKRKIGKMEDGHKVLAKGLAAVAAGQASDAGRYAVKARKALGETPTTRLLLAQSAQLAGDEKTAQSLYQTMTTDPETAILGYRGLIMSSMRAGNYEEAGRLAARLEATKADIPWLHLVKFDLAARIGQWRMASLSLEKARKGKALQPALANRHEAALLLADAKTALRDSSPQRALELAEKARKLRPDWLPALLVLAEAQIVTGHTRTALKTVFRAWETAPHPQLLPLAYWAMQDEKPIEKFKGIEKMTRKNKEHFVSLMALADAALKADLWGEARRYLMVLVNGGHAMQSTYQMLARLEQRERKNETAAAQWIARAIAAPSDPQWVCSACGAAHPYWEASCLSCGSFNRMEWARLGIGREGQSIKQPTMLDYIS
jgi:HemY protein